MKQGRRQHQGDGWLVLERRVGEVIRVGDVLIMVREVRSSQVKLAINAEPNVAIHRGELPVANADGLLARVFGGSLPLSCRGG